MVHLTLGVHGSPHIVLFIIHKKRKNYKSITYTKIKLYIILFLHFFPRMNNKKVSKRGRGRGPTIIFYK